MSCRCIACRSALLPEGSGTGSSSCTHHVTTDGRPNCTFQAGYFSLAGLAISRVPDYQETQDACKKTEERESKERSGELKDRDSAHHILKPPSPRLPPSRVKDGTVKRAEPVSAPAEGKIQREGTETRGTSELSSPCARVTEGSSRPVAAPRRMLDSSGVPVPAPRTRAAQPEVSSPSAGERPRLLLTAADTFFCTCLHVDVLFSFVTLCFFVSVFPRRTFIQ